MKIILALACLVVAATASDSCRGVMCMMYCEYGFVLDERECPTCECKPDPCSTVRCSAGTVCVLQEVQCVTEPCHPQPVCKNIITVQEACSEPMSVGRCRAAIPRFYYNSETNSCDSFSWGGCHPNGNNFVSHSSCISHCKITEPICPPVCAIYCKFGNILDENGCPTCTCNPDPCDSERCAVGEQCVLEEASVAPHQQSATCKPINDVIETCETPLKVGPCRGVVPRYYFNSATRRCEEFSWGGCDPNANNFETLTICESHCPAHRMATRGEPICPPVCAIFCKFGNVLDEIGCPTCTCNPDPCDSKSCAAGEQCVLEETSVAPHQQSATCKPINDVIETCQTSLKVGPCRGVVPRYYFNSATQRCEEFSWGGCDPNANNFETLTICESHCPADRMVRRSTRF